VSFVAATAGVFVFVGLLFLGSIVVPGPVREGAPQPDGAPARYRLNGLALFLLAAALVAAATALGAPLESLPAHFLELFVAANLLAFVAAAALFTRGRRSSRPWTDFFHGAEANPAWAGVDLKLFSYRPSLIGLALINVSFAALQFRTYGALSLQMWLYQIFCLVYVANYFQFEQGMLFTWDLLAERLGWLLLWGDYVLVPFFYSLPAWYLVHDRAPLGAGTAIALSALYLAGFWLFRGANGQKHRFRTDPEGRIWGRPARSIGGKLLVSGFWGIGRKLNYTGELLMYYAWTFLCGFSSFVPYLVPLWLTVFLPHRAWRDDRRCRAKYGTLWDQYCARARFRMVPFVY